MIFVLRSVQTMLDIYIIPFGGYEDAISVSLALIYIWKIELVFILKCKVKKFKISDKKVVIEVIQKFIVIIIPHLGGYRIAARHHLDLRDGSTNLLDTWYSNNIKPTNDAHVLKFFILFKMADWWPFWFWKIDWFLTRAFYVVALFSEMC